MSAEQTDGHGILLTDWWNAVDQRSENFHCEALAFSGHNIDLLFDEENMKPEKLTKASGRTGINRSTVKMKEWYLEPTREDDDLHFPFLRSGSDALTGADRTSYPVREPIENDEQRLAMNNSDMPPLVFERVANQFMHYRTTFELGHDAPCYS